MTRVSPVAQRWPGQTFVTFAALIYLLFVVYGSLVPLNFQPAQALQRLHLFFDSLQLDWHRQSRADVVINVLLAFPLVFFWCAVTTAGGRRWPIAGPFLVWWGSACVSIGVELLQIYFPPRTPSLVDFAAQLLGAALGVVFWSAAGRKALAWIAGIHLVTTVPSLTMRLLLLYGVGMLCYGLFPLDLTLSPADIYRKWRAGHVLLVPFSGWRHLDAKLLYGFAADVALFVPIGILARLAFPRFKWMIVFVGSAAAAIVEFLQLFVLSRTTDATQIAAGCIGATIGVMLATRIRVELPISSPTRGIATARRRIDLRLALAAFAWFLFVCAVFWYPYDFQVAPATNIARNWLSGAPLEQLFFQSELRAATELLRKTFFFAPLGVLLAFSMPFDKEGGLRWLRLAIVFSVLLGAPLAVEYGKLFLPGKFPGGTNVVIEFAGGVIGFWAALCWIRWRSGAFLPVPAELDAPSSSMHSEPANPAVRAVYAVLLTGTLLWLLTKASVIPYDLGRFPRHPYLSMLVAAGVLIWAAGYPAWIARRLVSDPRALVRYPLLLIVYPSIAWVLIFLTVEPLQVRRLIGAPVLAWPWHFEWLLRHQALMAGVGVFAVLGCITGGDGLEVRRRLAVWSLHAAWLLPLTYWGVFVEPANDSVVELLGRGAKPLSALMAGLAVATVFAAAARLRVAVSGVPAKQRLMAMLVVLLSFPMGFWLLHAATDPMVVRDGKVFSGMQLILGADGGQFAVGATLVARYCLFHLAFVLAVAAGDWLFDRRRGPLHASARSTT